MSPTPRRGPQADIARYGEPAGWHADGDMVHAAYTLHAEDDDWGQTGTLDPRRPRRRRPHRLVNTIVGQLLNGVSEPVLLRAFEYLHNVDKGLGDRVEQGVRAAQP
jgi:catalase